MYICLLNPYGVDNGEKIWYRKRGIANSNKPKSTRNPNSNQNNTGK